MAKNRQALQSSIDEGKLTQVLYHLSGDDGSEKGIKRRMRLEEVKDDIFRKLMRGENFALSDFAKLYGLFILFELDCSGFISLPYEDVFEWIAFKKEFYEVVEALDDVIVFKRTKGRPSKGETVVLTLSSMFCRSHNKPDCPHRDKCLCNYSDLLVDALELRLAKSKAWVKAKTAFERQGTLDSEFKAAKTAVDRIWKQLYGRKPPKLYSSQRESIKEFACESLAFRSKHAMV